MGGAVVLPLRRQLSGHRGNDDVKRGIPIDHTTIYRWGQKYAPQAEQEDMQITAKFLTGRPGPGGWMKPISGSAGRGATFDLAIIADGQTLDFYLSPIRNTAAAKRFLVIRLRSNTAARYPRVISADKVPSLAKAIFFQLKKEGICSPTMEHRQVKSLNNVLEGDPGRLKRIMGLKGAFKKPDFRFPGR